MTTSSGAGAGPSAITDCARTSAFRAELGDVGAQRVERGLVLLDEQARRRAARQRLQPQRARSGEQVGDRQPLETADPADQHREQRLARAVGGRARRVALRRDDRPPAPLAGDDPHYLRLRGGRAPGLPRPPAGPLAGRLGAARLGRSRSAIVAERARPRGARRAARPGLHRERAVGALARRLGGLAGRAGARRLADGRSVSR